MKAGSQGACKFRCDVFVRWHDHVTATMNVHTRQQMQLEVPTQVLRSFQQALALDQALLSDVRAAVQELHDRIQYVLALSKLS